MFRGGIERKRWPEMGLETRQELYHLHLRLLFQINDKALVYCL